MPLEQRNIPLHFLDGSTGEASATGNNAAWDCPCGYTPALIGRSGMVRGVTDGYRVDCPSCPRSYFVVPAQHDQDRALRVDEVERP